MIVTVLIAAGLAFIPASIAKTKGRSFAGWYLYGFLLFVVALIHALAMKPTAAVSRASRSTPCPYCSQPIWNTAVVCCCSCGRDVRAPRKQRTRRAPLASAKHSSVVG